MCGKCEIGTMFKRGRKGGREERNNGDLFSEWRKSGARGRGEEPRDFAATSSSATIDHRAVAIELGRKEGTSSAANTSLGNATPPLFLSSRARLAIVLAGLLNLWLKKVPDGRSRSFYL